MLNGCSHLAAAPGLLTTVHVKTAIVLYGVWPSGA